MSAVKAAAIREFLLKEMPVAKQGAEFQELISSDALLERFGAIVALAAKGPVPETVVVYAASLDPTAISDLDQARALLQQVRDLAKQALAADERANDPLREAVARVLNQSSRANGQMGGAVTVQVPLTLMRQMQTALGASDELDGTVVAEAGKRTWGTYTPAQA